MPHIAITMTAHGTDLGYGPIEVCAGCMRPFRRGERMNAVEYANGDQAGWHCDECIGVWKTKGEEFLSRWELTR